MPWHSLRCLGKQKGMWGSLAAAWGQHPPPAPWGWGSHSQVTLSPSAEWQMRYLASAPGQAARGDGVHWRTTATSPVLMLMGTTSESACKKNPGDYFRRALSGVKPGEDAPALTHTVAVVAVPQGEGGPAALLVPAVHGQAVTARRSQRSWGGTGVLLRPSDPGWGDSGGLGELPCLSARGCCWQGIPAGCRLPVWEALAVSAARSRRHRQGPALPTAQSRCLRPR